MADESRLDPEGESSRVGEAGQSGSGATPGEDRQGANAHTDSFDQQRVEVTQYYVTNQTSYGVYVAGNVQDSDLAGRDHAGPGRAKEDTHRARRRSPIAVIAIATTEFERLSRVWVEAGPIKKALDILDRERIVVLRGPEGVGKGAAARFLLGRDNDILEIDPSVTVKDLCGFRDRFPYGEGRSYVINAVPGGTVALMNGFTVRTVQRELAATNSRLVLTVADAGSLSPELGPVTIDWEDRPDVASVLRSHLALHCSARGGVNAADVPDVELHDVVVRLADRHLRDIDHVARALADGLAEQRSVTEILDELGFGAQAQVDEWFSTRRTSREIAFLLAVAVLNGYAYQTVAHHADALEACIAGRSRRSPRKKPLPVLESRASRAHGAMAVLEPGLVLTGYGSAPAETIRMESHWLVPKVLELVWKQFDIPAAGLVDWMLACGDDRDPGVRLRVSAAAGWLACFDFATICDRLITPWALGSTDAARTAADAIGLAALNESSAPLAFALLRHWARSDDYDLWWTAAVAYGGEAGVRYPSVAMQELMELLLLTGDRAGPIVAESVVRLVNGGGRFDVQLATVTFSHLNRWVGHEDAAVSGAAQLACALVLRRAADSEWPASTEYRNLLTVESHQSQVGAIVRATLGSQDHRRAVLDALRELVVDAGHDGPARDSLQRLLVEVATGPGSAPIDRERLLHYLDRWATAEKPAPAAAVIADQLRRGNSA